MSTKAGNLLWNRVRVTIPGDAAPTEVDTGLIQLGKSFDASSVDEPPLGESGTVAPAPGTLPASRIQVIPLAPTSAWANITHSEPFLDTATGTIHVTFSNSAEGAAEINVLFWNPHSAIGPGEADTYNAPVED